jgi:hypothetical protein
MYLQNPKPVWNHGYSPYRGGTMNLSLCLRPKFKNLGCVYLLPTAFGQFLLLFIYPLVLYSHSTV